MSTSMIPKVKELKLISIYLYICDIYNLSLKNLCQRFSNNNEPEFTDQEVMTIYLFVMNVEQGVGSRNGKYSTLRNKLCSQRPELTLLGLFILLPYIITGQVYMLPSKWG